MENTSNSGKTQWHCLLGGLFEELLVPLGVSVFTEFSVMSQSPVADILLLRKERGVWTSGQLERLPDGIRETRAKHVLIEFKYTESTRVSGVTNPLRALPNIRLHRSKIFDLCKRKIR